MLGKQALVFHRITWPAILSGLVYYRQCFIAAVQACRIVISILLVSFLQTSSILLPDIVHPHAG
jgi:hypothetical protein